MSLADAIRRRIPERWIRSWPTVRAVLVGYHVLAVVVLSFPSPPSNMRREAWDNPTIQSEFQLWSERLKSAGVNTTPRELDQTLFNAAQRYHTARANVIAPFQPYIALAGVRQSWHLFAGPQRYPVRIEVSVREGRQWRKVYETRSKEHTWRRDLFDRYRMRRVVSLSAWKGSDQFQMLCDWIATQAARDFPAASEVMVRQFRYRTPTPAEAIEGKTEIEGKHISREVRPLEKLR